MSYNFHETIRPQIIKLATTGPSPTFAITDVADFCQISYLSAEYHVYRMRDHGEVERVGRGAYRLAEDRSDRVTAPDPRIAALKDAWRICESTALTAKQAEVAFLNLAREIAQS